jgi:DNA-binding NarL/FixJ family response regulator
MAGHIQQLDLGQAPEVAPSGAELTSGPPAILNILIVEDNANYRHALGQLLMGRFPSLQIAEAEDADEALRQTFARRFDLIFMDIRLPRGNGLDLTTTIKAIDGSPAICVLTASDIPEYREAAFLNGADRFMVKGECTESAIVGLVESLLRTTASP